MFWGLQLEAALRYSQQVPEGFRITKATLDARSSSSSPDGIVQVFLEQNGTEYAIATLKHGSTYDAPLDLRFAEGEDICFFLKGDGVVFLVGHHLYPEDGEEDDSFYPMGDSEDDSSDLEEEEEDDDGDSSEEEEDSGPEIQEVKDDAEVVRMNGGKAVKKSIGIPQEPPKKPSRPSAQHDSDDDDDSEDDDEIDFDDEDDMDEEGDMSDMDSDEESEDEEDEVPASKPGQKRPSMANGKTPDAKKSKISTGAAATPKHNDIKISKQDGKTHKQDGKTPKQEGKTPKQEVNGKVKAETPASGKTPGKGDDVKELKVEDIRPGSGPAAKRGKRVHVYYTGMLMNGKKFDACTSGKPFSFKLGTGQVIPGWEQGLEGMKVGGKRRLVIPARLAYGKQGTGPIPPNASLRFEVELKAVN